MNVFTEFSDLPEHVVELIMHRQQPVKHLLDPTLGSFQLSQQLRLEKCLFLLHQVKYSVNI